MGRLEGKNIIVTGGSRGIGFAVAVDCLKEGANAVAIFSHYEHTREAALEKLRTQFPGRNIEGYSPAISDEAEVGAAMKDFIGKYGGKLDAVCHLVGVTHANTIRNIPDGLFREVVETNLFGTYAVNRQAALIMCKQRYGSIINTSSIAALYGAPMGIGYGASKAGVLGMTRSLARGVARFNVRVNCVCPGVTETDMTMKDITPEALAQVNTTIAMGRMGKPEEISKMFIFLASDESSYCTGGFYHVDGWSTG